MCVGMWMLVCSTHAYVGVDVRVQYTCVCGGGCSKILHTLTGMGSAAFAAAVPYPGKTNRISRRGQRNTKRKNAYDTHSYSKHFLTICPSLSFKHTSSAPPPLSAH